MGLKEKLYQELGPKGHFPSKNFNKSYKLVFLQVFISIMDLEGRAKVIDVASKFAEYYKTRKAKGLATEAQGADSYIHNIETTNIKKIIKIIDTNLYDALNKKGFLSTFEDNNEMYYQLSNELLKDLSKEDIEEINFLIEEKLDYYYKTFVNHNHSLEKSGDNMEILHLIIKYKDSLYSIDTLEEHRKVIRNKGKVVWGIIKPNSNSPGVSNIKIQIINNQVSSNIPSYMFTSTAGKITAKGIITEFISAEQVKQMSEYVPSYYRKDLDKCVAGIVLTDIYDEKSEVIEMLQRYETEGGDIALGNQTNPLYVSFKSNYIPSTGSYHTKEIVDRIYEYLIWKGYTYKKETITNLYLSLKSKPFVILAGTSGTGKSKLVQLFAEAIGATSDNGRYQLVPVKPDWSDATDLLGYRDLHGHFHPGILTTFLSKAVEKPDKPFILCLDEMNLARVEYYLSDVLSIMETRKWQEGRIVTDKLMSEQAYGNDQEAKDKYGNLHMPDNVYIVGTVNMDETTFPFSKKVLDRANTIEFSYVDLDMPAVTEADDSLSGETVIEGEDIDNDFLRSEYIVLKECMEHQQLLEKVILVLKQINEVLHNGNLHFGYRIRDEICYFMVYNEQFELTSFEEAIDCQILQKILPRIQGSSMNLKKILIELFKICIDDRNENYHYDNVGIAELMEKYIEKNTKVPYKQTAQKIASMIGRFEEDGFTSYWM